MIRATKGERIFRGFNAGIMIILMIISLYPLLYVAFSSISDPVEIMRHRGILLWPMGFDLSAYKAVLSNPMIGVGYKNTLIYLILGTAINILMTSLGAYALSRKIYFKNHIMFFITFTMFFNGGMIPNYLLIRDLHLLDNIWAMIIPGAISAWNLIIMRTSFQEIPQSLEESARIDGAGDFTILFIIILPLSLPVISVMTLFYGVGHWNEWFNAMLYFRKRELFPLQLVLREILITNSTDYMMTNANVLDKEPLGETIKYATIMAATVPILFVYPFLQKYFVKGVMIGAIKE